MSVYDFCKQINAQKILIVTNRPAIANSWYSDYEKFLGTNSGYLFVSAVDSIQDEKYVLSRKQHNEKLLNAPDKDYKCIEFVSLQDLKGSLYFGGQYDKLKHIKEIEWDVLVVDEAHEGIDTYKTDLAFDQIKRCFTLHLSGTPFKALANSKFPDNAIFNWTYADEQKIKTEWDDTKGTNPYENLPKLNLYTYQMSEIIKEKLHQGIEIQGETEEYAFDLNEFFRVKSDGKFVYEESVDHFLDALTVQEKFPFSTPDLRDELKHTFWLLNRVDSAKALAKKLKEHPVFEDYCIINVAGETESDEEHAVSDAFNKVTNAIKENEKTITLSVGRLTTGITIPEWTAVLMLSNVKSPALYMQAAFRAQNSYRFKRGEQYYCKENAYIFDFDPARTLTIFEEFANDLYSQTSDGRGDVETRTKNIRTLLNFFPVIGEDEKGEMIALDAEKILSIPRKIRSQEVVKRGIMSDFLFQNISNVFHAPMEVIEIIQNFEPVQEPQRKVEINQDTREKLSLDDKDNVTLTDDIVIGVTTEIFGNKIYETDQYEFVYSNNEEDDCLVPERDQVKALKDEVYTNVVKPLMETAVEKYGSTMHKQEKNSITKNITEKIDYKIDKAVSQHKINMNELVAQHDKVIEKCDTKEEKQEAYKVFEAKKEEIKEQFNKEITNVVNNIAEESAEEIVRTVETNKRKNEKQNIENSIKDHLRGFSRTIPSFLMAYGDNSVNLKNFDQIIPAEVFFEVTSITLEQFRFLRDGGDYIDQNTGEKRHFKGQLFDAVVFDDSIKEFLNLKKELANYFEESSKQDIFDYIPPQKTNQIFTPKNIVIEMVDMLEKENPGCFNQPDKTFIDLYMKSGLYVVEIVKRLYRSESLKKVFPNKIDRLKHIFEKQVYGLAPTEIIYQIALNYILGFDTLKQINKHNFKKVDTLPYAKEGTLQNLLDDLFN